ncbi:MAG TPA: OsmC family protein [Bryobacteraceae bacterium]|jgi:putative redox protein|nr:OsmC family protein [Bryobacteraceae bacterium]
MAESPSEVVVRGNVAGFTQEITAGPHRIFSDEPKEAGGENAGASPYELLTAALGACTSMTIGMYARRKKWPLASVNIWLRHLKVHADDCADCESKDVALDRVERDIELIGNLTAEQRAKLVEIADKCPLHRTITRGIEIKTRLL